ncbi:MAG: endospore germination permease [Clostridia bacterium]|nr:endospore germination permease [Clostridia bacterium]
MIANRQFVFAIASFIASTTLFTAYIAQIAKHNSWIILLLAGVLSLLVILLYSGLTKRFPKAGLMQIHSAVYGKKLGLFLNILYIVFFLLLAFSTTRNVSNFFITYIMPETPINCIILFMTAACAFAVGTGMKNLFRNACFFFLLAASITLTNFFLLIPKMHLSNFLPLLQIGWDTYCQGTLSVASVQFCEIIAFLSFLPFLPENTNTGRALIYGLLLGIGINLLTFVQDIAVLGVSVSYLSTPSYESVRLIHVMDVFTRLEILYAFLMLVLHIFKISILYCAIIQCIRDAFHPRFSSNLPLVLSVGIVIALCAIFFFSTGIHLPQWRRNTGMYVFSAFEIALPLITFLIALCRRKTLNKN